MKKLGNLATGEDVFDRTPSHIHNGVTEELLIFALSKITPEKGEERVKRTIDFGREIGVCVCVKTDANDEIIYAQRVNREGLSRFVKSRQPEKTSLLTVTLRPKDGRYELRTAYLGPSGFTEPWATDLQEQLRKSIDFWSKHALCWGYEPIISGTETIDESLFFSGSKL